MVYLKQALTISCSQLAFTPNATPIPNSEAVAKLPLFGQPLEDEGIPRILKAAIKSLEVGLASRIRVRTPPLCIGMLERTFVPFMPI